MPDRPRLTPAIAELRRATRAALDGLSPDALVLVALSGGSDSLALAAALAFEAPRGGWRGGALIVDHGLQNGSADVAARAAQQATALGLAPVRVERVWVGGGHVGSGHGGSGHGGPEAAARLARYAALERAASDLEASVVLLAHTLDDQAETVLLGLARGSGAASLQGMPAERPMATGGSFRRPLLGVRRATTVQACADAGLEPWLDPHNADPGFTRVRVRQTVLPVLEAELGPGVAEALARTAEQLREDAAALDTFAAEVAEDLAEHSEAGLALPVDALAANPPALRQRIIRLVVSAEFGVALSRAQTLDVARLVTDWHGQTGLDLPGVRVVRRGGKLRFEARGADGTA
ncbi:tRNA lysidine(34) synthetase TilS [Lysinimonas soli]|uniref:tRNA(Ile)-lysidine synthase n=1 Tax=Lysinimonas soli TaxID=1074233 RepID=A0ABW0NS87_9MICO